MSANLPSIPDVLRHAGPAPWLLGYDVNAVQELITAPSRPIAMLGVSATIRKFDEGQKGPHTVFAGGGRGLLLVPGETEARSRGARLVDAFREQSHGGVLATACVPYDPRSSRGSLRWLHGALDLAKDAAAAPGAAHLQLPRRKSDECADCNLYTATHTVQRKDGPDERICGRCLAMADAGRSEFRALKNPIQSLVDLDPWIAAVSLDGNNLGDFFGGLDTLETLREASQVVFELFHNADEAARAVVNSAGHDIISLATGGDDIRLFMSAVDFLPHLTTFVRALESGADTHAKRYPALSRLGVGIGAVIAAPRLPARQLMNYAHALERSAKRICRVDSTPAPTSGPTSSLERSPKQICRADRTNPARSALDFAVLTAGTASIDDTTGRDRQVAMTDLPALLAAAARLQKLPSSQLALLDDSAADFQNLLCYQVARSADWQRWYADAGHNWRDPEQVLEHRPCPVHLDLARIQKIAGGPHAV